MPDAAQTGDVIISTSTRQSIYSSMEMQYVFTQKCNLIIYLQKSADGKMAETNISET
jgi:hypothetical protein